ncbi:hypothetical protein SCHPADRAFT_897133 [Schizopora paradoxa]|uniref:Uncharacterized protein n=1 Tax=Schizopora paradoxa TaxID=27342 RepID=A0A0H2R4A4_9AGAM|nr:hypothetical protein SCHPADRAFT_897133 [Schizopora paradoxa]
MPGQVARAATTQLQCRSGRTSKRTNYGLDGSISRETDMCCMNEILNNYVWAHRANSDSIVTSPSLGAARPTDQQTSSYQVMADNRRLDCEEAASILLRNLCNVLVTIQTAGGPKRQRRNINGKRGECLKTMNKREIKEAEKVETYQRIVSFALRCLPPSRVLVSNISRLNSTYNPIASLDSQPLSLPRNSLNV